MSLEDFPRHFADRFPELVGGRLLVALSGGPDSVALLHLLADPSLGLELEAAHVHHLARRAEADRDAEFCRALCERRGVPFHLLRLAPEPAPREGREAAWRRRRYRALLEVVAQRSLDAVATAHHRDDVAEGVIMQLLRGAGPRALAGIRGAGSRSSTGCSAAASPGSRTAPTPTSAISATGFATSSCPSCAAARRASTTTSSTSPMHWLRTRRCSRTHSSGRRYGSRRGLRTAAFRWTT
jgi:tRNA(Ile)-lysidine synthetase-like protein